VGQVEVKFDTDERTVGLLSSVEFHLPEWMGLGVGTQKSQHVLKFAISRSARGYRMHQS